MFERMPLMGDIREEIDSVGKVMAAVVRGARVV